MLVRHLIIICLININVINDSFKLLYQYKTLISSFIKLKFKVWVFVL